MAEPLRLDGEAAEKFMDEMIRCEQEAPSAEESQFADQCARIYQANMAKRTIHEMDLLLQSKKAKKAKKLHGATG